MRHHRRGPRRGATSTTANVARIAIPTRALRIRMAVEFPGITSGYSFRRLAAGLQLLLQVTLNAGSLSNGRMLTKGARMPPKQRPEFKEGDRIRHKGFDGTIKTIEQGGVAGVVQWGNGSASLISFDAVEWVARASDKESQATNCRSET
jgi:hypothetical protein